MKLMELLEKLNHTKKDTSEAPKQGVTEVNSDYQQDGYETSKSCRGRISNLKTSLEAVYEKFFNQCKKDTQKQQQLKLPYQTELDSTTVKISNKEKDAEAIREKINTAQAEIEQLKQDIVLVKKQPENFGINLEHKSTIKLWIGVFLLSALSVYIFIFYISTAYSAFFKDFSPNSSLFNGVFEANALAKAFQDGALELGFVLFIPFVFFSLGYLIHMFWERKQVINYCKVAGLLIITFLFDSIMAYLIDEKVYNLNRTLSSPDFTISLAFQSVNFWLIIFAGFVAYIVWGLVFDMVMTENTKRNKIETFRKSKRIEILHKDKKAQQLESKLTKIENEISELKIRITELNRIIPGFILPIQNYKAQAVEYLKGWQKYIAAELTLGKNEQDTMLQECRAIYDTHIKQLDLQTDDYQNKIFTQTL